MSRLPRGRGLGVAPTADMTSFTRLFAICFVSTVFAACASDSASVDLGSSQAGSYSFDVAREGDAPSPGAEIRVVLKATAGGMPTSVTGWVGLASAEGSVKVLAVYDSADGDFDDDVTVPSPLPDGSKFYFDVLTNDTTVTGSVALK
jgi:hypothetical protein